MNQPATTDDTTRIGALIRLAGELYEAHGPLLHQLADQWADGPNATSLEPGGGWRHEPCDDLACPIPGDHCHQVAPDSVADAALAQPTDASRIRGQLQQRVTRLVDDATWLRDAITVLALKRAADDPPSDALWCTNHLRARLFAPQPSPARGGLCRWCYDFRAVNGILPTPKLLGMRERGERVTEAAVADEVERQRKHDELVEETAKGVRARRRRNQNQKSA